VTRAPMSVLLTAALLLATACGGDDDTGGAEPTPSTAATEPTQSTGSTESPAPTSEVEFSEELCGLLGEDDLAVIGPVFSTLADQPDPGEPHVVCTYTLSTRLPVSVQLFVDGGDKGELERYDVMLDDNPDYAPVDGVGEAAARMPVVGTLIVWTANGVQFSLIGPDVPDRDNVFLQLAETVVARLEER
jgi:hypothetical protein